MKTKPRIQIRFTKYAIYYDQVGLDKEIDKVDRWPIATLETCYNPARCYMHDRLIPP